MEQVEEAKKVYIAITTLVEKGMYGEDDVKKDMHAFSNRDCAITWLMEGFYNICDDNDVDEKELGKYEFFNEKTGEFHLQENPDSPQYGDWYANGYLNLLDID